MKFRNLIFSFVMLLPFWVSAQSNYLPMNSRYRYIAGKFDSTLHIPSGATPGLRTGGYNYRGALFYRTTDSSVYVYTGTQWIQMIGSGGSTDSTIFATLYRLDTAKANLRTAINLKLSIADTANKWVTAIRRSTDSVFYNLGGTWTFAYKDSVGSGGSGVTSVATGYGLSGGTITSTGTLVLDSATTSAYYLRRKDSVSASNPLGFVSWKLLRDTASAIRSAIGGGSLSGSGTNLQVALWNGTSSLTGHQRYTYTNSNDYPSLIIGAGSGATYGASLQLRDVAGTYASITSDGGPMSFYGSSTYKSLNFYDYAGGAGILARFYSGTGVKYNEFQGLGIFSTLSVPSNEQGAVTIARTVPYSITGNNYHGFTDQTDFRIGNAAFNGFGTFVKIGNNRTNQDHLANFQSVYYKDSSNSVSKIYGFVNAVSSISGGNVDSIYGYYNYNPTVTGGATVGGHYGVYVPVVTGATRNVGIYSGSSVGIGIAAPTEMLHVVGNILNTGTIKTGDPGSGTASWKIGQAITTSGLVLKTTEYVEIYIEGKGVVRLAVVDPPTP